MTSQVSRRPQLIINFCNKSKVSESFKFVTTYYQQERHVTLMEQVPRLLVQSYKVSHAIFRNATTINLNHFIRHHVTKREIVSPFPVMITISQ